MSDNLHQKQRGALCGMHALNNLIGEEKFVNEDSKITSNQINIVKYCTTINRGCLSNQWFSDEVLIAALREAGYFTYDHIMNISFLNTKITLDNFEKKYNPYFNNDNYVGTIINSGTSTESGSSGIHWIALKKHSKKCNNQAALIDSMNDKITCIKYENVAKNIYYNSNYIAILHVFSKGLPEGLNDPTTPDNADEYQKILSRLYVPFTEIMKTSASLVDKSNNVKNRFKKITNDLHFKLFQLYITKNSNANELLKYLNKLNTYYVKHGNVNDFNDVIKNEQYVRTPNYTNSITEYLSITPDKIAAAASHIPVPTTPTTPLTTTTTKPPTAITIQPIQSPPQVPITLGANAYTLCMTPDCQQKRHDVFNSIVAAKTEEELKRLLSGLDVTDRQILEDVGFLVQLEDNQWFIQKYAPQVRDFLNELPNCTTDAAILAKQECSKAYYLIFSLLHLVSQMEGKKYLDGMKDLKDLELAKTTSVVNTFKDIQKEPGDAEIYALVMNLVQLRRKPVTPPTTTATPTTTSGLTPEKIREIFTLGI